jgi:hypothetical protein
MACWRDAQDLWGQIYEYMRRVRSVGLSVRVQNMVESQVEVSRKGERQPVGNPGPQHAGSAAECRRRCRPRTTTTSPHHARLCVLPRLGLVTSSLG